MEIKRGLRDRRKVLDTKSNQNTSHVKVNDGSSLSDEVSFSSKEQENTNSYQKVTSLNQGNTFENHNYTLDRVTSANVTKVPNTDTMHQYENNQATAYSSDGGSILLKQNAKLNSKGENSRVNIKDSFNSEIRGKKEKLTGFLSNETLLQNVSGKTLLNKTMNKQSELSSAQGGHSRTIDTADEFEDSSPIAVKSEAVFNKLSQKMSNLNLRQGDTGKVTGFLKIFSSRSVDTLKKATKIVKDSASDFRKDFTNNNESGKFVADNLLSLAKDSSLYKHSSSLIRKIDEFAGKTLISQGAQVDLQDEETRTLALEPDNKQSINIINCRWDDDINLSDNIVNDQLNVVNSAKVCKSSDELRNGLLDSQPKTLKATFDKLTAAVITGNRMSSKRDDAVSDKSELKEVAAVFDKLNKSSAKSTAPQSKINNADKLMTLVSNVKDNLANESDLCSEHTTNVQLNFTNIKNIENSKQNLLTYLNKLYNLSALNELGVEELLEVFSTGIADVFPLLPYFILNKDAIENLSNIKVHTISDTLTKKQVDTSVLKDFNETLSKCEQEYEQYILIAEKSLLEQHYFTLKLIVLLLHFTAMCDQQEKFVALSHCFNSCIQVKQCTKGSEILCFQELLDKSEFTKIDDILSIRSYFANVEDQLESSNVVINPVFSLVNLLLDFVDELSQSLLMHINARNLLLLVERFSITVSLLSNICGIEFTLYRSRVLESVLYSVFFSGVLSKENEIEISILFLSVTANLLELLGYDNKLIDKYGYMVSSYASLLCKLIFGSISSNLSLVQLLRCLKCVFELSNDACWKYYFVIGLNNAYAEQSALFDELISSEAQVLRSQAIPVAHCSEVKFFDGTYVCYLFVFVYDYLKLVLDGLSRLFNSEIYLSNEMTDDSLIDLFFEKFIDKELFSLLSQQLQLINQRTDLLQEDKSEIIMNSVSKLTVLFSKNLSGNKIIKIIEKYNHLIELFI